jgi:hypothetical protein
LAPPNSAIICRHIPHGGQGRLAPVTIATATIFAEPAAEIPAQIALRSAQVDSPNEEFSTLQPAAIEPFAVSTAAPTRNPE